MKRYKKLIFTGMIILLLLITSCRKPTAPSVPSPEIIWTTTLGGTDDDWGFSVIESSNGGYIIVGSTESYGEGERDVYVIKTDVNGDTLWTKTYGGEKDDVGVSIQKTSDSGYIIAGRTSSFGSGYYDVYLIKINDDGDTQWAKTYGGTEDDGGVSVQQTSDGGYIIGGNTESYGEGESDVYLIKIDETGSVLWTKTYGGTEYDGCLSIQETSDGGYIAVGLTTLFNIPTWNSDVYVIKTDANGNALWTEAYGGTKFDIGYSVHETSDGGYIIAGATSSGGSNNDVYLIKIKE